MSGPAARCGLLLSACAALARGGRVTISNASPRLDTAGRIVNAHDGSLLRSPRDGRFYLYGTRYAPCAVPPDPEGPGLCPPKTCGWFGNTYAAYSSPDLSSGSWRLSSARATRRRPSS